MQVTQPITAMQPPSRGCGRSALGHAWVGRPAGFCRFKQTHLEATWTLFSYEHGMIGAKASNLNAFSECTSAPAGDWGYLIIGASTFDCCPVLESFLSETRDTHGLSSSHFT